MATEYRLVAATQIGLQLALLYSDQQIESTWAYTKVDMTTRAPNSISPEVLASHTGKIRRQQSGISTK